MKKKLSVSANYLVDCAKKLVNRLVVKIGYCRPKEPLEAHLSPLCQSHRMNFILLICSKLKDMSLDRGQTGVV